MDINKQGFDKQGIRTLLENRMDKVSVKFGTVTIPPGERVPSEGLSCHKEHEYGLIVSGGIKGESGGKVFKAQATDATLIPAGEEHWAINPSKDEDCKIVWVLVEEK